MRAPLTDRGGTPLSYTPTHLAEQILISWNTREGERMRVSVLFAALTKAREVLADRAPEEAQALLDPGLERLMAAM